MPLKDFRMSMALISRVLLSANCHSFYQKTALGHGFLCCSSESTSLIFHHSGIIYKQLVPGLFVLLKPFQHYSHTLSCAAINHLRAKDQRFLGQLR